MRSEERRVGKECRSLTVKLLQASKDFWLRRGVNDWGIVVEKEGAFNG